MTPSKPASKVKFEVAQEDLDILLDDLRALGCREARVVKVSDLAFMESISRKCEVPHCGSYGNTFQCPPYTPEKAEVEACIPEAYKYGVVGVLVTPSGEMATPDDGNMMEVMARAGNWSAKVSNVVSKVESRAQELGYYKAMGFNCGACTWCGMWTRKWYNDFASGRDLAVCTVIRDGICQNHRRARPSVEPLGINMPEFLRERDLIPKTLTFPEISADCAPECPFYAFVLVG